MAIVLGIDPGSRITGFGVVQRKGYRVQYLASGIIRVDKMSLADKLKQIFRDVTEIVQEFNPEEVAIEQVFVAKNADSALKLGQARGAAITAVANFDIPVFEYAARAVKKSVVGTGQAEKRQVQSMIQHLLKLSSLPQVDAADALAIAMCHCHHGHQLSKLSGVTP